MKYFTFFLILLISFLLTPAKTFAGAGLPPMPVPLRLAVADCAFVGTITKVEAKPTAALPYPGATMKIDFTIAVVKLDKPVTGTKGLTHVRVGYYQVRGSGGVPRYRLPRVGEKALFLLRRRSDLTFFPMSLWSDIVYSGQGNNPGWKKLLEEVDQSRKLLQKPIQSLKSKEAGAAWQTASMLLMRYRTPPLGPRKEIPIDGTESRLILEAMAKANWKSGPRFGGSTASLFSRLGLTAKDDWQQPKDFRQLETEAKAWLKKHAKTYRIKRFTSEKP